MILGKDDGYFQPLLQSGDEFRWVHQVGAVTDQDIDFALRLRHADADAGGHLVAHAGEAELKVAVAPAAGVPELEQVAGRATGGGDHGVACAAPLR